MSNGDDTRPATRAALPTLPNLRDLGGHRTADGRFVRTGQVYRSSNLGRLDAADSAELTQMGIRTVYDLRTEAERSGEPDRMPDGAALVILDVLADEHDAAPAQVTAVLDDPHRAQELLGDGKAADAFHRAYRDLVSLPSARAAYRSLYTELAESSRTPALFHCTAGKDRTGWGAAALLLLLGVGHDEVMADYLRTNDDLLPAYQPILDRFAAEGGDPEILVSVLGVDPAYLETALNEVREKFGSIAGYFSDGLGIDGETQDRLRTLLTA